MNSNSKHSKRRPATVRLTLERLEDRFAPAAGMLDPSFNGTGIVTTAIGSGDTFGESMAIQNNGRIVVAGSASNGSKFDFALARYNVDGSLDTTFSGGIVTTAIGSVQDQIWSMAIDGAGKIVAAGYSTDNSGHNRFALARYDTDGSLDTTFNGTGIVTTAIRFTQEEIYSVTIDGTGKIVAAGYSRDSGGKDDFALARYNPDGSLDTTFNGTGTVVTIVGPSDESVHSVTIDGNGKIVVAGSFNNASHNNDFVLARYNADGSLDTTFAGNGIVTTDFGSTHDSAYSVAIDGNGKIVAAGRTSTPGVNNDDFALARYNPDGSLDTSFGAAGLVRTDFGLVEVAKSVAIDGNGKIVVAGLTTTADDLHSNFALARYNQDGSLDPAFGADGKLTTYFGSSARANSMVIDGNGNIVAADSIQNGNNSDFALARYEGDQPLTPPEPTVITFGPLSAKTYGDADFTVSASASSGLPVSFSIVAGAQYASIVGDSITLLGATPAGSVVTVEASQAGDANHTPATPVDQSFTIDRANASVTVSGYTGVYDGNAHGATGSAAGIATTQSTVNLMVTEYSNQNLPGGSNPNHITAGPDGNLWFTDRSQDSIGRITPQGSVTEFSTGISANSELEGITAGPDGNLWFTEIAGNHVGRITPQGSVTEFSTAADSNPLGIAIGPDGNLWFTENGAARIGRITPQGSITEFSGITGSAYSITTGPDGNLWFTEYFGNRIGRITPQGSVAEFDSGISSNRHPYGITAGPDGNLWFTEQGDNIGRSTPQGSVTEFSTGNSGSTAPNGITVGPGGNFWVSEFGEQKIASISIGVHGEDLSSLLNLGATFTDVPGGTAHWTFAGNSNYNPASGTASIVINQANTTTTVTSSTGGNSYYGQSVAFTAAVAARFPGGGTPVGTVQFLDNEQVLSTATLANGTATWTTSALGLGVNGITVNYLGSSNYLASTTLAPLVQTVHVGILLLDRTGKGALTDSGNGKVVVDGDSIVVDSSNAAAVVVTGNGSVQAALTDIGGGDTTNGHGRIVGTIQTGQRYVNDPLAGRAVPDPTTLTVQSRSTLSISGYQVVTLNPGLYIGGINISGNAKVTLKSGVYFLQGGGFSVSGGATATDLGAGVLIYNAPAKSSDTISFSGNGRVQLSALTSGPWAGIMFFQDRTSSAALSVTGNGNLNITGTIYAAGATLNITGNAGVDDQGTSLDTFGTSLILDDLVVSGNGSLVV